MERTPCAPDAVHAQHQTRLALGPHRSPQVNWIQHITNRILSFYLLSQIWWRRHKCDPLYQQSWRCWKSYGVWRHHHRVANADDDVQDRWLMTDLTLTIRSFDICCSISTRILTFPLLFDWKIKRNQLISLQVLYILFVTWSFESSLHNRILTFSSHKLENKCEKKIHFFPWSIPFWSTP